MAVTDVGGTLSGQPCGDLEASGHPFRSRADQPRTPGPGDLGQRPGTPCAASVWMQGFGQFDPVDLDAF